MMFLTHHVAWFCLLWFFLFVKVLFWDFFGRILFDLHFDDDWLRSFFFLNFLNLWLWFLDHWNLLSIIGLNHWASISCAFDILFLLIIYKSRRLNRFSRIDGFICVGCAIFCHFSYSNLGLVCLNWFWCSIDSLGFINSLGLVNSLGFVYSLGLINRGLNNRRCGSIRSFIERSLSIIIYSLNNLSVCWVDLGSIILMD
jgi:hypothetical protein